MGNNKKTPQQATGLPVALVQTLAWLLLIGLFVVDKWLNRIAPPLNDVWYAAVFGVAAFGRGVRDFLGLDKK